MNDPYNDGTYLHHNQQWHQEDSPYKAGLVMQMLRHAKQDFKTCADVGCGAGRVTAILAKAFSDKTFYGFDTSKDAARFWAEQARGNLTFSSRDIFDIHERFDLVLCLDVFEHVDDYIGFLRQVRKLGSRFVFNIPLDMCAAKLITGGLRFVREEVGHLHYFNAYTAVETMKYAGYEIEHSFLSAMFKHTLPRNIRQVFMLAPRILTSLLGNTLSATLTGGYSLVVLASAAKHS
jgi:SAM-dependent methyltransferase